MTEPRRFGKYSKIIRERDDTIKALCQQMEHIGAEKDKPMTDDQIKYMVDRFLGWKLPGDFNPDGGISFKKTFNDHMPQPMKNEPIGTNLLDAMQADAMVRHMIEGLPPVLSRNHGETNAISLKSQSRLATRRDELHTPTRRKMEEAG